MSEHKLTAVIMNWARPANVVRFVGQYARHPRVAEVVVWDASRDHPLVFGTSFDTIPGAPVRYVRSVHDFGLYPRFLMGAAGLASGVLLVDDDIELPADTVTRLHDEYLRNPLRVHGLIGRRPDADGTYTAPTRHGPVEVVLTRALVTSPWLCARAAAWGTRHVRELPGEPRGNGEDIVLSYVAMAESGRLNAAYDLPYVNRGYDDAHAISVRVKGHGEHRTRVVRWCRDHVLCGPAPVA